MNQQPTTSNQPPAYPKYYRKDGRCVRQDAPTSTWTIGLPPEFKVPVRFPTEYPSAERLEADLKSFTPSTAEEFKSFVATFYQQVGHERQQFSNHQITESAIQ